MFGELEGVRERVSLSWISHFKDVVCGGGERETEGRRLERKGGEGEDWIELYLFGGVGINEQLEAPCVSRRPQIERKTHFTNRVSCAEGRSVQSVELAIHCVNGLVSSRVLGVDG